MTRVLFSLNIKIELQVKCTSNLPDHNIIAIFHFTGILTFDLQLFIGDLSFKLCLFNYVIE